MCCNSCLRSPRCLPEYDDQAVRISLAYYPVTLPTRVDRAIQLSTPLIGQTENGSARWIVIAMNTSLFSKFDFISRTGAYIAQSYETNATRAFKCTVRNFASLSWSAKALISTNSPAFTSKGNFTSGDSKMLHTCVSTPKATNVSN